jgi:hypothetical protein
MKRSNPQSAIPGTLWVPQLACAMIAGPFLLIAPVAALARHADSVPVFHCTFGDDWDVNYDVWPDRWVRKTGLDYPHYVNIAIQDDATAVGGKSLAIDLDGAAAAIASPPIGVISRFSYVFEVQLKNEDLNYSRVIVTLDFCDSKGRVLQTAKTEAIGNTKGWQAIRIGPVEPRDRATDRAVIGMRIVRGIKGDLRGRVSLADVRLERLPRIDISTDNPCNFYTELGDVVVKCALSGIRERNPEIHFQLLDGSNRELQSESLRLPGQLISGKKNRAAGIMEGGGGPDGYEGELEWQPKIPDYGFYRVVVRMMGSESEESRADNKSDVGNSTVDIVVAPPLEMPRRGEFGWTLPDGDQPLSFQELSRLLPQVGINWAKVPVWFDANDPRRGDELIRFVEMLGASNIDVVGIIDRPPPPAADPKVPRDSSIADVLSIDSSPWVASLEPVMSRLALRVRWWQLGGDYDTSLIGLPTLNKRIGDLRSALFRFGQDVRMGLCSDWEAAGTYTGNVAWDFVQLTTPTQPTPKKLDPRTSDLPENSAQRWIAIEPPSPTSVQQPLTAADIAICLPAGAAFGGSVVPISAWVQSAIEMPERSETARTGRATEFVHRLISAKLHGADAIFVTKPFDDDRGLMRADGMPAELLLPWRTTAAMLGGAHYLGEIQLPAGSENRIFLRPDGQVVMVAWNSSPAREALYLGANVRQIDILGRTRPATLQGREQVIDVGPAPTFVLGLHEAITRWRMHARFERTQVPSIFSKPHVNALVFKNYFPQGVGGSVKIVVVQNQDANEPAGRPDTAAGFTLDRWTIEPPQSTFQIAPEAEARFPFDVKLKNALYGKQPIRVDFAIEADERLEFSVYRAIEVGTEDLALQVRSHLDKDGVLVVEQLMANLSDRLADFKCHLRSFGRQPQRMQVYRLGRQQDRKVYRIPDGRELVGKEMLLEIEELNGPRMLNYRFVASEESPSPEDAGAESAKKAESKTNDEGADAPRPLASVGS